MNTNIRTQISKALDTEMDRAGFLKYCGVVILAALGLSGLLRALASPKPAQQKGPLEAGSYGGRAFGE